MKMSYRHKIPLGDESFGIFLEYRRSRSYWLGEVSDGIRKRELFGWLRIGRRRVAALQLYEYELSPWLTDAEFIELMDMEEQIESSLAGTLVEAWEDIAQAAACFGNLIDFRMAWSDPSQCPPRLWAKAANLLIEREFCDYSIVTMKAFPLEYEGRTPTDSPAQHGLQKRRLAMMRHYRHLFNTSPFPGDAGDDGWLYKIHPRLRTIVPAPNSQA